MIYHGDSLEVLRTLGTHSVDAVVTDPPYGLKFMGKKWDYDVPTTAMWSEVLRVLKPGGHLLSFGGTRTYHRMVVSLEDAGFEVRDQIQWLYGSGFPKSHNLGNGIGTALKPANEPIVLARKPLSEKTVAANVLKWGCGGLNIDASRIDLKDGETTPDMGEKRIGVPNIKSTQGRWPANLLLDEVAAEMLDEQSIAGGMHSAGKSRGKGLAKQDQVGGLFGVGQHEGNGVRFGDSGGASRFFYCAKSSKGERGEGNGHPTVKPLKLMEYLCRLITQPGGTILDPFMGSGSTGVAAKNLNFKFIGIEMSEEYVEIARKRIGL